MGVTEKYDILNILEFNSDRKRMSAIVRTPAKQLKLYTKGADSIIAKRLTPESLVEFSATEAALTVFATEGLRTLCLASVELTESRYRDWKKRYEAALAMPKTGAASNAKLREEKLDELMSEIESNLTLLGATAIEDQLQVF